MTVAELLGEYLLHQANFDQVLDRFAVLRSRLVNEIVKQLYLEVDESPVELEVGGMLLTMEYRDGKWRLADVRPKPLLIAAQKTP